MTDTAKPPTLADFLRPEEIDDLIEPVCTLADLETTTEARANHTDKILNALIVAARVLRDREGFLVTDGDDD